MLWKRIIDLQDMVTHLRFSQADRGLCEYARMHRICHLRYSFAQYPCQWFDTPSQYANKRYYKVIKLNKLRQYDVPASHGTAQAWLCGIMAIITPGRQGYLNIFKSSAELLDLAKKKMQNFEWIFWDPRRLNALKPPLLPLDEMHEIETVTLNMKPYFIGVYHIV
ncbi:hypothetical protein ANO14919_088620 [Xylariales sp. No.14919]|nr:hypothetical protein ANO14919_088620 [Xylariales sp. No.14919]